MRKVSLAARVILVVAVCSVSAIGQQSSPAVLLYPATSIDLPVEPARMATPMTLADAAKHNDFPMFDAMFNEASRTEAAPYAELHSFWKWSLTDPVGAFYGDEMHAKFATEYPGYAGYIADFGIIDSHGRAFYPSAETRTFLLRQAALGEGQVPRLAEMARPKPRVERVGSVPPPVKTSSATPTKRPALVPRPDSSTSSLGITAAPLPVVAAPPVVIAPIVQGQPRPAPITPRVVARPSDARLGRGLLLIIAGLIGLGMLSVMLHAPSEEPAVESDERSHPLEPRHMIQVDEKPKKTA